ncbi:MAG: hypothetical protein KKC11_05620 [Candidatus Omnitrophica bacterium]|nr:hypothetical protein [Candidatus Omnitrophota bacterium]MBU0878534.1 hypothetical protein [Candidatus Omnitrophota bacterium]MBU0897146.1 hypothetical protein [Candidatus Omnitrophota bacterium]MBU1133616.1 hypothetical protein [Candidatus Omnitrophota bacterium]MBU1523952.1 hypothetical protein [Candidatus Omnitrophota bacterium]
MRLVLSRAKGAGKVLSRIIPERVLDNYDCEAARIIQVYSEPGITPNSLIEVGGGSMRFEWR